jgi:hypothetical protein
MPSQTSAQVDGSHVEKVVGGDEMGLVVVTAVRGMHPDDVQALSAGAGLRPSEGKRKRGR